MATIHKLDQRKQSDRRTALLGLAADQPVSAGVCLTPEDMAKFLENKCQIDKKEQYLRHIAVCDNCYQEWLTLQEVLDKESESKRGPRVFKILKPGNIALFGTLLAAAASVVIFLNINYNVTEKESLSIPVESMRQEPSSPLQEKETSLSDISSQAGRQAEDKDTRNAPTKSVMKTESSRKKLEIPVSNDALKIEKKKSAPAAPAAMPPAPAAAPKREELPTRKSFSAEKALPQTSGEGTTEGAILPQAGGGMPMQQQNRLQIRAVALGQWREQLENGCRERQESEIFWQEIQRKGRELATRSGELKPGEKENLENLLLLTTGMEKNNIPEQCRRILDLLVKERVVR